MTTGINELVKSIPLNGVYCGGSITIIDLSTPGFVLHSDFFSKECCHAILMVSNVNIEYWLRRIPRCFDIHLISGNISQEDFTTEIKKLIINIMCLTCYWEGVKEEVNEKLTMKNSLTLRECEVLKLYCMGLGVKEIARKLSIDPKTVSAHKYSVMKRMTLKSNADLFDIHQQINNIQAIIGAQEQQFSSLLTLSQQCRLISPTH
ncbi:helix-turn-helix transcriptional regulator [Yersinia kristensenii]|uniref:helix-turn-helix domain-containing protein n=1 Tax=Yersinia kristensenii TaxID=28152 RepID=UPI003896D148